MGFFNHTQRKHKCPWRLYLGGKVLNTPSLILPCPYPFCWMNYFHHTKFPRRTPHSMLIIISLLLHFIPRILTRAFCEVYGSRCNVDTLQRKALWQMALLWRGREAAPSFSSLFPGLPGDMLELFSSTDTQPSKGFRHLRERVGNLPVLSADPRLHWGDRSALALGGAGWVRTSLCSRVCKHSRCSCFTWVRLQGAAEKTFTL